MNTQLVSICIPVFNASNYIESTVNNFLYQTYDNIEILIQDDCSTDGTWEILNQLYSSEPKIKLYRNDFNMGIGPNWNNVYEWSVGEYVVIANADDIHDKTFIEKSVSGLEEQNADFISFKYQILFEETGEKKYTEKNEFIQSGFVENAFETIFFENPFHIVFTMFRKKKLEEIMLCNQLFLNTQVCDAELMLRYSEKNTLLYVDEVIGFYRIHNTNNSSIPLAETRSFFFGVLPIWHPILVRKFGAKYRRKLLSQIIRYIKNLFKGLCPFDYKLLKEMINRLVK